MKADPTIIAKLFSVFLPLMLPWLLSCQTLNNPPPTADKGQLDLRNWNFTTRGKVKLNGEWIFYWQKFLVELPVNLDTPSTSTYLINLPSAWNSYEINSQALPAQGYATYHLKILLPEQPSELAINIPTAATAMALYANNQLIYVSGEVGSSATEVKAAYAPDFVHLPITGDTLNLYVQVSNFHYYKGGAWSPFILGNRTDIRRDWLLDSGAEFFLAGCIFIMALYHLGFFFFRREEYSHLIFGLACLLIVLRVLCTGQYLIRYLLPLNWVWTVKLEMLSFYMFVPLFLTFLLSLFPKVIPQRLSWLVWLKSSITAIFVVVTPPLIFSYTIIPYQILTGVLSLFVLYKLFRNFNKHIPGQKILLIGLLAFFLTFINDVLYANNIISTAYIISLGLLVFILAQSFLLSQRVSLAIHGLENVNQTLSQQNDTIHNQNNELTRLNKELDVFVYRTSHDLRAPLSSTLGLIEVLRMEEDPKRFGKYLDMQEKALNKLDGFIQDILDYSRNTRLELVKEKIDFKTLLEEVFSLYQHLANFDQVEKNVEIDQAHDVYGDKKRLVIIFNNLVSNAFRYYNPQQEQPYIQITITTGSEQVEIIVQDNGLGIAEEHQTKVFEMFYRASNSAKGSGLGLFIVKESVNKMKGRIQLKSKKGEGTTFTIILPNHQEAVH
ncbi:sensor histidine kinase [Catalinimonas niigatensis]|uniref:sensor histidine kinase n=1 Tax=Catalinimonas niigatensis TaxID=1397264 RepID=UPI002665DCC6|nr:sensor histidine kinase [Catalinimonas niigatensis]WPP52713.1 sensor histidine kinase [Catalinimonas niigatensis]